jgi:Holliday junction resolvase RusA-like endonuclease
MTMKLIINDIPPSNNKFIGRNARWAYQKEKKKWEELIYWETWAKGIEPSCLAKAKVIITYYFKTKGRRDPDNYSGKMLLDPLVRNKILQDDSFFNIELVLRAFHDKEKPRTEIEIIPLEV